MKLFRPIEHPKLALALALWAQHMERAPASTCMPTPF
jgi:hypothetical protein